MRGPKTVPWGTPMLLEKLDHSDMIAAEASIYRQQFIYKAFTAQRLKVCRTPDLTAGSKILTEKHA